MLTLSYQAVIKPVDPRKRLIFVRACSLGFRLQQRLAVEWTLVDCASRSESMML